jgi:hypothetical protein
MRSDPAQGQVAMAEPLRADDELVRREITFRQGGEAVDAIAAREPGPARNRVKKWAIGRLGEIDRDSPIATDLERGISQALGTESARSEARALAEQRAQGAPLWREAMDGGDLPKVEERLAKDYQAAQRTATTARTAANQAAAKVSDIERTAASQRVSVPRKPTGLITFLIRNGGLQDQGGEVSHVLGGKVGQRTGARPGLLNNKAGKTLDDAALDAWEAGYLKGTERPTINDLIDAIAQDHNAGGVFSELDEAAATRHGEAVARNRETDQRNQQRPVPAGKKVTAKQLQFERDKLADIEARARHAEEQKAELAGVIEAGQVDGTLGLPGAVWSPRLGRLLENPRVQQGLGRGMKIERDLADAEGRRFNPRDYALVGQDAAGDPQLGAVPNMKVLAVAKEGLDALLESDAMRDPLTRRFNKEGRAVVLLRNSLVEELDSLNPAYKAARDRWAGDSALISAIEDGKGFHRWSPEEIGEWFEKASESEKKFYRIGAGDTLRGDLNRRAVSADPSKAIINNRQTRLQLTPMFRSKEDATQFFDRVKRAQTMFETPGNVLGGSRNAARDLAGSREGLDTTADILHGLYSAVRGHSVNAMHSFGRAAIRSFNPFAPTPQAQQAVNHAVALLMTINDLKVNVRPGAELLNQIALPQVQNTLQRSAARLLRRPIPNAMLLMGGFRPQ